MTALVHIDAAEVQVRAPSPTTILGPLDLQVERGESVAVVGPSGAGKSTLVSVLGGMLPITSGSYRFDGQDLPTTGRRLARFRAANVGFVFQAAHLMEERTAVENVELALTVPGHRHRPTTVGADALDAVGVGRLSHRPARVLSGGERQRVAVARALVRQPLLLIADEPTGSLDRASGSMVLDLLFTRRTPGSSLVLVTHDGEAAARADRRVQIVDGRIA